MIKNVIFDIGQVLVDFRWKDYIRDLGLDERTANRLKEATVLDATHWGEHDRGAVTDEEFIRESMRKVPGIEPALRLFFERIEEIVVEYDYAQEWVLDLKEKGMGVYLLSNYGKTTFEIAKERFRFLKHVDGMVISSHVRYVKPEPQIYQALLDKYDLKSRECVFIDDRGDNVEAAKRMGFHAILFHGREQAERELAQMGVPR